MRAGFSSTCRAGTGATRAAASRPPGTARPSEKSPGTSMRSSASRSAGQTEISAGAPLDPHTGGPQQALGVVARRRPARSTTVGPWLAYSPARSTHDLTCAEATGSSYSIDCELPSPRDLAAAGSRRVHEHGAHQAQRDRHPVDRAAADRLVAVERERPGPGRPGCPAAAAAASRRSRRRSGRPARAGRAGRRRAPAAAVRPSSCGSIRTPIACIAADARQGVRRWPRTRSTSTVPSASAAEQHARGARPTCRRAGRARPTSAPAGSTRRRSAVWLMRPPPRRPARRSRCSPGRRAARRPRPPAASPATVSSIVPPRSGVKWCSSKSSMLIRAAPSAWVMPGDHAGPVGHVDVHPDELLGPGLVGLLQHPPAVARRLADPARQEARVAGVERRDRPRPAAGGARAARPAAASRFSRKMSTQMRAFAPGDAGHVAERAADRGQRVVPVDPAGAGLGDQQVREHVRQVARQRQQPVVGAGVDRHRRRAERGDEGVQVAVALRVGLGDRGEEPGRAVEQVAAGVLGAAQLEPGTRVPADEAAAVGRAEATTPAFVEPMSRHRGPRGGAPAPSATAARSWATGAQTHDQVGAVDRRGEVGVGRVDAAALLGDRSRAAGSTS